MLFIIIGCALITFTIRAVPFIVFRNKKKMSPVVKYLSDYLPPSIIAALIVYCIKQVFTQSAVYNYAVFIGIAVTAVIHILKKNTLLSITAGTLCYMIIVSNI